MKERASVGVALAVKSADRIVVRRLALFRF